MEQKVAIAMELDEEKKNIKKFYFIRSYEDNFGVIPFNKNTKYKLESCEFIINDYSIKIKSYDVKSKIDDKMDLNISIDDLCILQLDKDKFENFIFKYLELMYYYQKQDYEESKKKNNLLESSDLKDWYVSDSEDEDSEEEEIKSNDNSNDRKSSNNSLNEIDKILSEEEFLFESEESIDFFKRLFTPLNNSSESNVEINEDFETKASIIETKNYLLKSLDTILKENNKIIAKNFLFSYLYFPPSKEDDSKEDKETRLKIEKFSSVINSIIILTSFQSINSVNDKNRFNTNVNTIIGYFKLSIDFIDTIIEHINNKFKIEITNKISEIKEITISNDPITNLDNLLKLLYNLTKIINLLYERINLLEIFNIKPFFNFEKTNFEPILQMIDRVLYFINKNNETYTNLKNKKSLYDLRENIREIDIKINKKY
jgi:hypothetical protein